MFASYDLNKKRFFEVLFQRKYIFRFIYVFIDISLAEQLEKGRPDPGGICLFKVNNGITRTLYAICSNLTVKTPERHH